MPKAKLPNKNFKWTPELAYAIGLIATDGSLSSDGRHIAMRSSDMQLLKTFKQCLNLNNKISQTKHDSWAKKPAYRIQFGNVQFYRWLLKIGLTPAKTYTIGKLKIPNKNFRDFLRGHLDGDGSVYTWIDRYNTFKNPKYIYERLCTKFISASQPHLQWIQKTTFKLINIKGALIYRKRQIENRTDMWELKYCKKDSIKLLSWLYYNPKVPCLKRKRRVAQKFIK